MEAVTRFKTVDGCEFLDHNKAKKHLEKKIGDLLLSHAHKLTRIQKYIDTVNYLHEHLADFVEIVNLQNDLEIVDRDLEP
jgi:hypothetical protein